MTVTTPPSNFDPVNATNAKLQEYGFPVRPTDASSLADWTTAMASYKSDPAPPATLKVGSGSAAGDMSTYTTNWAGYSSGVITAHNHTYVAVKSNYVMPSIVSGTQLCDYAGPLAFWVGLGGTTSVLNPSDKNNLVQQGVICGNPFVVGDNAWRPYTEFADIGNPVPFCGYGSWTFAPGDTIYQNMGYVTSTNTANFYIEDETTGVAHGCPGSPPSGWTFDGNTADWESEASFGLSADFTSINFTNANAELGSTGSWVSMGSQSTTKFLDGGCIAPQGINANQTSFTDKWIQGYCI